MSLEVITGPMFSGKTEELLRRLRRHQFAKRNVTLLKPAIDKRWDDVAVHSHSGLSMDCRVVYKPGDLSYWCSRSDVIGVDEVQFFPAGSATRLYLESKNKIVIAAGLDLTFALKPWAHTQELMSFADSIDKLTAICVKCGEDANRTQRLVNGVPTTDGPDVLIGGLETYEARCRSCFEL